MFCRYCGTRLENSESYCTSCGRLPLRGKEYCQNCGTKTNSDQVFCISCQQDLLYKGESINRRKVIDEPNTLANFGTFCCNPIIGLILYIVWKDEKPIAAQSVCNWTIAGIILSIVLSIIYFILMMSLGFTFGRY